MNGEKVTYLVPQWPKNRIDLRPEIEVELFVIRIVVTCLNRVKHGRFTQPNSGIQSKSIGHSPAPVHRFSASQPLN